MGFIWIWISYLLSKIEIGPEEQMSKIQQDPVNIWLR